MRVTPHHSVLYKTVRILNVTPMEAFVSFIIAGNLTNLAMTLVPEGLTLLRFPLYLTVFMGSFVGILSSFAASSKRSPHWLGMFLKSISTSNRFYISHAEKSHRET